MIFGRFEIWGEDEAIEHAVAMTKGTPGKAKARWLTSLKIG